MKYWFTLLFGMLFCSLRCSAQDGAPDASFGVNGIAVADSIHTNGPFISSVIQKDGKILVGAKYQSYDSNGTANGAGFVVKRFLQNGIDDSGFNPDCRIQLTSGQTWDDLFDIMCQSTGRILINDLSHLCALLPDGTIDSAFGNSGSVIGRGVPVVFPDDKILMVASGNTTRLKANGTIDSSYGLNGIQTYMNPGYNFGTYRPAITPDNKIILLLSGSGGSLVIQLTGKGTLDSSFAYNGISNPSHIIGSYFFVQDLRIDKSGKILIAGFSQPNTNYLSSYMMRYLPNGILDSSFAINGKCVIDSVARGSNIPFQFISSPMNIQADGRILHAFNCVDSAQIALRRFMPDGTIDYSFGTNGKSIIQLDGLATPGSIVMQADSKIIVAAAAGLKDQRLSYTLKSIYLIRYFNSLHLGVLNFQNKSASPSLFPNPIQSSAKLSYELTSDESVSIFLTDITGKMVQTFVTQEKRTKGLHSEQLNISRELAPVIIS